VAEFFVISIWTSYDAVRGFTGNENPEAPVYCEEDYRYLLFLEPKVMHFEILIGDGLLSE
jgi:hypothetical protein